MFTPGEHEELFEVKPIGIRYKCEHCGKGEMKVDIENLIIRQSNAMYKHRCTECGGELLLPKMYPYIEWVPIDKKEVIENETAGISMDVK